MRGVDDPPNRAAGEAERASLLGPDFSSCGGNLFARAPVMLSMSLRLCRGERDPLTAPERDEVLAMSPHIGWEMRPRLPVTGALG